MRPDFDEELVLSMSENRQDLQEPRERDRGFNYTSKELKLDKTESLDPRKSFVVCYVVGDPWRLSEGHGPYKLGPSWAVGWKMREDNLAWAELYSEQPPIPA